MDFNLDETQQEIADLALRILEDRVDHNRLKEIEAGPHWFDRETYAELAKAGLVGIALREDVGGGAMTLIEAGLVVEQQGRTVAPMPLLPTIVAALAITPVAAVVMLVQPLLRWPGTRWVVVTQLAILGALAGMALYRWLLQPHLGSAKDA